ncbi:MAG: DegV family protein [Clostridium sp.]
MQKVKIITDSSCDLDLGYLGELSVDMSPLVTILEDGEFLDRVEMGPEEFYNKLKNVKKIPTTSQASPASFKKQFEDALNNDMEVFCIAFSSKLSGTYQSALIAKEMLDNNEKIEVIDSLCASVGQGLLVEKAALMAKEGKSRVEISSAIQEMASKMEHLIAVGSLEMLKMGGRISSSQAAIGSLLNVKPILQIVEGAIQPLEKCRGKKGVIKKLVQLIEERGEDITNARIGLSYSQDRDFANEVAEELKTKLGVENILITEIGSVIGSHVGPATVNLCFVGNK